MYLCSLAWPLETVHILLDGEIDCYFGVEVIRFGMPNRISRDISLRIGISVNYFIHPPRE